MPKPQTNLRLDTAIRDRAIAAAKAQGIAVATLVERALTAYLDGGVAGDSGMVSDSRPDTRMLSDQIADLIARVEILESQNCPSQDAQEGASTSFQVSQHLQKPQEKAQGTAPQGNTTPATAPTEGEYRADGSGNTALLPGAGDGLKTGEALLAAGAPGVTETNYLGRNYSAALQRHTGQTPEQWLSGQGWERRGAGKAARWYPPIA